MASTDFLNKSLRYRADIGLLRALPISNSNLIDFASNDYLGFARSEELRKLSIAELETLNFEHLTGSTGSRLLTGNSQYAEDLEKFIAGYHKAEAGLIFNSGYTANIGTISCVAGKEDVILYDELSHASIYDGVRLSKAQSFPFRHNDLNHLENRLKNIFDLVGQIAASRDFKSRPTCFVIVESVYSMDGDFALLAEIVSLCEKYKANLIVDEAHATGIFGEKGEGRVVELGLEQKIFARMHTFGKALGCHGAIVLGSEVLRNYLINFSRPFIYTTALPFHSLVAIRYAYDYLNISNDKILKINNLIKLFNYKVKECSVVGLLNSHSPIQSLIMTGNDAVKNLALSIQKEGYDVRPILSPTVPKGKERIRICLHAFNTEDEIDGLLDSLKRNLPSPLERGKG